MRKTALVGDILWGLATQKAPLQAQLVLDGSYILGVEGVGDPFPVHTAVTGVGSEYPADSAIGPGRTRERFAEFFVGEFSQQGQRDGPRNLPKGDDFIEALPCVLNLPFIGHGMHARHNLGHSAGVSVGIGAQANGIFMPGHVATNHPRKVVLNQRQVGQMVERAPQVRGVMLARSKPAVDLFLSQRGVFIEQPNPAFVQLLFDFETSHSARSSPHTAPSPPGLRSTHSPAHSPPTARYVRLCR
jgi:hypothetical protein